MELREFAGRVLFATSVEEKLLCPRDITDEHPGSPLVTPEAPGRPAELRFKPHGAGKTEAPALHHLEQSRERGRLLHFFANHELLATELMALVLLKFPDAPSAFRKGVLQTLEDEQGHTRLYLERMKACGIEFGELPVSGYFWRCIAPMENPIDYVAGLCLTFEQANLDFARHFARGFATVGDDATAKLLEKIYRDEIGHVAYGLKWFRRWKNPSESDWDAFCRTLKFPLSPQRAKGFALNVEGRRAAGLDPHFIAELNVYSQSKGRTPSVFVFNPFAEGRIAEGKSFNSAKHQAQLARDLETLPQFLCRQDDIVLVNKRPSVEFLSRIKQAGFALPEFVELNDGTVELGERKLGRLRPWAWSPDSVELLSPLFANVTAEKRTAPQRFNENIARLYSKVWSAALLRKFLSQRDEPWLCTEDEIGVAVNSLDAALETIAAIRQRGHHKIVVKQAVGLAGSNAMRLFEPEVLETHRRWIENSLAGGHELLVEPWLEREVDFSVQLEMTENGLKVCGYTELLNDTKGQYRGNVAEPHHHTRIPASVIARFREAGNISGQMLALYAELFASLESELRCVEFVGPLGIDAFVYRGAAGTARLKPVVEINPRYTMGRVTVELMRQACQGSFGYFRLVNRAALRAEGCEDFAAIARELGAQFPLRLEGAGAARIREGALCLNDPATAKSCVAVFQVGRSRDALRE
jgi:uncharacterized ferritin-like protein (DUF455 family)